MVKIWNAYFSVDESNKKKAENLGYLFEIVSTPQRFVKKIYIFSFCTVPKMDFLKFLSLKTMIHQITEIQHLYLCIFSINLLKCKIIQWAFQL